jgi:hypothetical protein
MLGAVTSIPLPAFTFFFVVFAFVALIVIVKTRADLRAARLHEPALPSARIAGTPLSWKERIVRPSAFYFAIAGSALCSFATCCVLNYAHRHHAPEPEEKRTYDVWDLETGDRTKRVLTDTEVHEAGYQSLGDGMADKIRREREKHAAQAAGATGSGSAQP